MKVMIVEDEEGIRRLLCKIIERQAGFTVVAQCGSFNEAVLLYSREKPDIVFMDIEIKEHGEDDGASDRVNGMGCARILMNLDSRLKIIFVTAHSEYMSNAFDIYAYDYIVKPFDVERVERTLHRIAEIAENGENSSKVENSANSRLMIKGKESIFFIDTDEIIMIERREGSTVIHTVLSEHSTSMGLGELMDKLTGEQFMRSHKSYIINLDYISRIEPYGRWTYVVKFNGKDVDALITAAKYEEVKKRFC